jgi:hypothetical protein
VRRAIRRPVVLGRGAGVSATNDQRQVVLRWSASASANGDPATGDPAIGAGGSVRDRVCRLASAGLGTRASSEPSCGEVDCHLWTVAEVGPGIGRWAAAVEERIAATDPVLGCLGRFMPDSDQQRTCERNRGEPRSQAISAFGTSWRRIRSAMPYPRRRFVPRNALRLYGRLYLRSYCGAGAAGCNGDLPRHAVHRNSALTPAGRPL